MDTCVSIQRPRPSHLAMNLGSSFSEYKSFTASLKMQSDDWTTSCRSTSSATLKSHSLYDNNSFSAEERMSLETEFKEQIEIFKRKNEHKRQRRLSERLSSKENTDSDTTKNQSPSKSSLEMEEKDRQIAELQLLLQEQKQVLERQQLDHQQLAAEKEQEIQILQENLKKVRDENHDEKQNRISLIEEEIKSLVPEDIEALIDQINQLKTDKSILTEELHRTLERADMACNESEYLRNELNEKVKSMEEKAHNELELSKREFLEKIDELEREKIELSRSLAEAKDLLQGSNSDADSVRTELFQLVQKLQDEKQGLLEKLDETEIQLRASLNDMKIQEAGFQDAKAEMQKEISVLHYELNECKVESLSYISELKDQNSVLRESINNLDEEKYKLEEKFSEYVEKFDSSLKEISDLRECKEKYAAKQSEAVDRHQIEQKLQIEKDVLQMRLEQSERSYNAQIFELEETLASKEHYIDGLLVEVSQLKKIIEERYKSTTEEKEAREKSYLVEEMPEIKELEERDTPNASPVKQEKQEEMNETETKEPAQVVQEVQKTNKPGKTQVIVYYIDKPGYSRYRNYYDSYQAPVSGSRKSNRNTRSKGETVVYKPKVPLLNIETKENVVEESQYQVDLKSASSQTPRSATSRLNISKEAKIEQEALKSKRFERKPKEEDPVYKQLEKMVMELNEKLFTSDKRAKTFYEEKLQEVAQQQTEREQNLLDEVEKLKNLNKELLKRIDDAQWEQAYAYTEKKRLEKLETEKAAAAELIKKNQALAEAKKKKKANNNKSINQCSFHELTKLKQT